MARIFQVLESSSNTTVVGNQTWYRNLYEPLVEMGHEVMLFSAKEGRSAMQRNSAPGRAAFSQNYWKLFAVNTRKNHLSCSLLISWTGWWNPMC